MDLDTLLDDSDMVIETFFIQMFHPTNMKQIQRMTQIILDHGKINKCPRYVLTVSSSRKFHPVSVYNQPFQIIGHFVTSTPITKYDREHHKGNDTPIYVSIVSLTKYQILIRFVLRLAGLKLWATIRPMH